MIKQGLFRVVDKYSENTPRVLLKKLFRVVEKYSERTPKVLRTYSEGPEKLFSEKYSGNTFGILSEYFRNTFRVTLLFDIPGKELQEHFRSTFGVLSDYFSTTRKRPGLII